MKEIRVNTIEHINNTNTLFNFASNGALGVGGANYGTSGQVLTSRGSGSAPIWNTPGGPTVQVFANVGTYTYTRPTGKSIFHVYCIGAGGGGTTAAAGSGGGSGGCAFRVYTSAEMGASASITIGAGGAAGGGTGGNTTFTPSGGQAGSFILTGGGAVGSARGTSTNAQVVWYGNAGGVGYTITWGGTFGGFFGGSTSAQTAYFPGKGGASVAYGGGKGGDGDPTTASAGDNGLVVVFEY